MDSVVGEDEGEGGRDIRLWVCCVLPRFSKVLVVVLFACGAQAFKHALW